MRFQRHYCQSFYAIVRLLVLLSIAILCSNHAHADGFISAVSRVDMVHDPVRNVLYITSGPDVLRYDIVSQQFLPPLTLGGDLRGIDISADSNLLAITDSTVNGGMEALHIVSLPSGSDHKVMLPVQNSGLLGTYSVAFMGNGNVLFSGAYDGLGHAPLQQYNPSTQAISVVSPMISAATMLCASADGSIVGFVESGSSDGPWGRYRVSDGDFVERTGYTDGTSWFNYDIATNSNGTQFAIPTYGGTFIYDSTFNKIMTLGTYASEQPIGVVYDPNKDVLYSAWVGTSNVLAYDSTTFTLNSTFNAGHAFQSVSNLAYQDGRMKMSRDGSLLFVTVDGGVEYIAVNQPRHSLSVQSGGSGSGTFTSNTTAVFCSGNGCTGTPTYLTDVIITANPNPGSYVSLWTGCDAITNNQCNVSMNAARTVTATFSPCTISVSASSKTLFNYAGEQGNISVSTGGTSCAWTATSMEPTWLTVTSGSGSGDGTATFTLANNSLTTIRTGVIDINGKWVTIAQASIPLTKTGVFRNGMWYLDYQGTHSWEGCGAPADPTKDVCISFGMAGDLPVVGNWNGTGIPSMGVFRNGTWYLDYPGTGNWIGCGAPTDPTKDACIGFGMAGDIPVVGNWNGSPDGKSKVGVFRNGMWYLDYPGTGNWIGCGAPSDLTKDACIGFGMAGDIPVVGNWNGSADGKSKVGVFRNGMWYLDYPGTGNWIGCGAPSDPTKDACIGFGMAGDIPVVGNWNGSADGKFKVGVFRDGWWYLDYNGNGVWDGCGPPGDLTKDACFTYGLQGDIPVSGQWQ